VGFSALFLVSIFASSGGLRVGILFAKGCCVLVVIFFTLVLLVIVIRVFVLTLTLNVVIVIISAMWS
jgi:hypothetical protein